MAETAMPRRSVLPANDWVVYEELRARQEIRCTFCCWPPGPLARRERRAYPLRYVRSEQHSQRACGPQPGGARRRAGICGVAAPRRCHYIACVAAPCICPPGARAKMPTYSCTNPKGRSRKAQGASLGNKCSNNVSPEGARQLASILNGWLLIIYLALRQ